MFKGVNLTLMMGPLTFEAVPRALIEALTSVQVTNSAGQRSGFQLSFTVGKESMIHRELLPSGFFDPPRRVVIVVTMNGQPNVIMDGIITHHEFAPSNEPGQSTLTVTGMDVSQAMDLIDFSWFPWPAVPVEARVAIMCAKYAPYGIIPKIVPNLLSFVPNPLEIIPKQEGTDLQYIKKLADDTGYVFYVEPGPVAGMNFAYWGPEIKFGIPQSALTVNSDAASNVESIRFSFDGLQKTLHLFYVFTKELKLSFPLPVPDITPVNPPLGAKIPIPFTVRFMNRKNDKGNDDTAKEPVIGAVARALARASQSSDVISASGTLDVQRYGAILRARSLVGVRGAGMAYDGHYFVKSVTHNIKRGEYKQNFTLSRNAHDPLTNKVSV